MALTLAMVGGEHQTDWDIHLPHVENAYNNSVNAATGLAPNEVHMGRLPRLPLFVFDLPNIVQHQSRNRDQPAYVDLATGRQQRSYRAVRELHAIYVSRLDRGNALIMDTLRRSPSFTTGGWAWIYNTAATICLCAKKDTDATILKTKLSSDWSGPFKILDVGPAPASAVPDGRALHGKLLYFYLPSDMPGRDSKRHVSVVRCKPCRNPGDIHDLLKNLPADLTKFVLNSFSTKSPPFNVTLDDISPPPERLEVEQITGHKLVCGRGGVLAVLYETHWAGFLSLSWERERDLQHHRLHILRYWTGTPSQHRQTKRLYRQMRIGPAHCELWRSRGERFLCPGYSLVSRTLWLSSLSSSTLPAGAHL